ncbi:hypothetical protein [Seleniivibrio sp.]|uniref:hypothetical protein n=1 Tax=Seleniivibrio sp. TaxID=2898801 RepID=UPI0025D06F14|nr:hypothetical protein [Seleniivibrio sp.]MCD8553399.1 hypothetical protein [Seleniivibrio sp.]
MTEKKARQKLYKKVFEAESEAQKTSERVSHDEVMAMIRSIVSNEQDSVSARKPKVDEAV